MADKVKKEDDLKVLDFLADGLLQIRNRYILWLLGFFVISPFFIGPVYQATGGPFLKTLRQIHPIFFLLGFLFLITLRSLAGGSMIRSIQEVIAGKKSGAKQTLTSGRAFLAKLLPAHLFLGAALAAVAFALFLVTRIIKVHNCFNIFLLIVLFMIVGVAFSYTQRFIVFQNMGAIKAWNAGFSLFNKHRWFSLRLTLTQLVVTLLGWAIAIVLTLILRKIPVVGVVLVVLILLVTNGFLGAAFHAMYTNAFLKLQPKEEKKEPASEMD